MDLRDYFSASAIALTMLNFVYTTWKDRRSVRLAWEEEQAAQFDKWRIDFEQRMDLRVTPLVTQQSECFRRVGDLEQRGAVMASQIAVFWKGVGYNAAAALHSPHTPEFDVLIEKFQRDALTLPELREFQDKLYTLLTNPQESRFRKKAAGEVLFVLQMQEALRETRTHLQLQNLHNVGQNLPGILDRTQEPTPDPPKARGAGA